MYESLISDGILIKHPMFTNFKATETQKKKLAGNVLSLDYLLNVCLQVCKNGL